jgi:hypothetical protein
MKDCFLTDWFIAVFKKEVGATSAQSAAFHRNKRRDASRKHVDDRIFRQLV